MDILKHHGILGMKWGVRRYQNEDGSLTPAGRKRYLAEYKRLQDAGMADFVRNKNKIDVDSYNETADLYNNGKIDEYNRTHNASDPDYESSYYKQFEKDWTQIRQKHIDKAVLNNENFKAAKELADKYRLYDYDEAVRRNKEYIERLERKYNV